MSKLRSPEAFILFLALALRLALPEIKPPHYDEGVNGFFADVMTRTGYYAYDPANYHGPLHFYAVFLAQTLFGRELWALRLPSMIAGVLAVWAMLRFREFFGPCPARLGALALAVSPAFVFYSRYSIHESWQVLFSILLLQSILGLWEKGERRFLRLLIFSLTGMILTKETWIIHIGCLLLAAPVLLLWQKFLPSLPPVPRAKPLWTRRDLIESSALGLFALVFFYSGTFLNFSGLGDFLKTFALWFHTGVEGVGHEKTSWQIGPINYYFPGLMGRYEWPFLAGLLAGARYILPSDARLRYVAIAALGTLLSYTLIPYKTPWCIISILWPFGLLFGTAADETFRRLRPSQALAAGLVAALLLNVSLGVCVHLNFFRHSDFNEPYVYVSTHPQISRLTEPLLETARRDPRLYHERSQIVLPACYPLPWILGEFSQIHYDDPKTPPSVYAGGFIAIERRMESSVEPLLRNSFYKRHFFLRDAQEECTAYFRADLFESYFGGTPEFIPREARQP